MGASGQRCLLGFGFLFFDVLGRIGSQLIRITAHRVYELVYSPGQALLLRPRGLHPSLLFVPFFFDATNLFDLFRGWHASLSSSRRK